MKRQTHDQAEEKGSSDGELLILDRTHERVNTIMRTLMVSNFLVISFRGKPNHWLTSQGKEFTYRH